MNIIAVLGSKKSLVYECLSKFLENDENIRAENGASVIPNTAIIEKKALIPKEILNSKPIVIVNGDDTDTLTSIVNYNLCVITCGLSYKATVTISSVCENSFNYCVQRSIYTLSGDEIAPQEFGIKIKSDINDLFPYMASVTALLICGTPINEIIDFVF